YIGDNAFRRSIGDKTKLPNQSKHEVELYNDGANIENLGNNAFYGAYLKKFHVSGNISDCSTGYRYPDLTVENVPEIWLPTKAEHTTHEPTVVAEAIHNKLADGVFTYATVDELTLGDGLIWIGASAFSNAKIGGGRIVVPASVKWLGATVFSNAKSTEDEKCVIEFADPTSIERLGASAFVNVNVVKLVIPANIMDCTYSYKSEKNLFTNSNINVYRFTNHTSMLCDSVFSGATVYDLTLNNHTFGKNIFQNAHVKTLTVNGDVLSTTGDLCNTSTQIYELKIGEDVGALVDGLFRNARIYSVLLNSGDIEGAPFEGAQIKELNLTENALVVGGTLLNNLLVGTVILPEGIESISAGLFTYSNIGTLVIPASVTKIDDFAFRATKVSNFRLAENSQLKEIGAFAFGGAAIDSYILPEGLEVIGNGAFAQVTTSVTSITLPSTLKHVGVKAFGGNARLNTVYVPEGMSADAVFDSPFDAGTSQNPLFIVAENAETYFRLKEGNEYFVGESNFTYVVTVKFEDEMGNEFAELEEQQVLFGIGYSTSLVYGQWVNNSRFAFPDEFYNYVWRCGDEIVSNVGNLDAIIRNGTTDTVILVGLHRVGGKYAFVARTNLVYNGTDYTDNINALLDNRFSLIGEDMDVQIVKYNQQESENITIKNAGTYTIRVAYDDEEEPVVFDIVIKKITTAWSEIPYVISWDYNAFDKTVNNINAVPNYLAADLPNADVTYTVTTQDGSELVAAFTTDENGMVVEQSAIDALNSLPVLADNGNYTLRVTIPETVNYTGLNDSLLFRVGVLNNTWTTSLKVMSWVEGRFEKEVKNENGETVYPIQAEALKGDVYIEVLANYTDANGKEIILLDKTLCGSDELTKFLSDISVGTYIIRASVDETTNYTGLVETFIFRVFDTPGLPWWVTMVVALGALLVAALIIFILWKKGVFQILTERIVVAIRTKASVDATIASVRAAKKMEEGKKSVADAKRRERIEQQRKKRAEERALPPEERAAMLEEKAKAHAERAEKSLARSEAIKAQAAKLRGEDVPTEQPTAEAAATEAPVT
ncbi:MAG: leucine-rich repeat protein, partial [Clostridiales bacterium]|nr:leucine-rich repeat protein [Clostridiales bacterium]